MYQGKKPLACALAYGLCSLGLASSVLAADEAKSPHKVRSSLELEFRTNDNVNVAPASTDSFDFADFADFAEAEAKSGEGDEEEGDEDAEEGDDGEGDAGDDFGSDDFADIGIDETDLSEEDFDLAVDDDDGDGDEDDPDDDGDDDDDDGGDDDDGDGKSADDDHLDDLIAASVTDKATTRKQSQNRISATLGFGHKYAFEGGRVTWGSTVRAVGDFHNGNDKLDKSNFAVSTGPEFDLKEIGWKFKPAVSYVFIRQHGNKVVGTLVGTLAASWDVNKKFSLDGVYNYQDRDITDPDSPDAVINTLTFGAEFTATKRDIFKVKYSPKVEDSSQVTKNKDTAGWQFTYSRKLPWEMILGLGVKNDSVDYVNLPTRREDDIRAYSVNLAKQFSKAFEMAMAFEERDLDSNINNKDAENRSFLISGTWKF